MVIATPAMHDDNLKFSRINITTFYNFPDMFRRYIRHLQCYIFWNRRSYKVRYIALSILRTKAKRKLNQNGDSKCVTLKMTDVPSKHVWKIKKSCYVYTTTYIVAAI